MRTVLRMNQHAKLHKIHRGSGGGGSETKWWILAAVISLTLIAIFIGLVVFLGLTAAGEGPRARGESGESPRARVETGESPRARAESTLPPDVRVKARERVVPEEVVLVGKTESQETAVVEEVTEIVDVVPPESLIGHDLDLASLGFFPIPVTESQFLLGVPTPQDDVTILPEESIPEETSRHHLHKENDLERRILELEEETATANIHRKRENKLDKMTVVNKFKPMPNIKPAMNRQYVDEHPIRRFDGNIDPEGPETRYIEPYAVLEPADDESFFDFLRHNSDDFQVADHPFKSFLETRLEELDNWLGPDVSNSSDLKQVIRAANSSIQNSNSSILLGKLREMYSKGVNTTELSGDVTNSSSLVSVGLLAFDLLLLHSVQEIAWDEQQGTRAVMMRDPDVAALNALFVPPKQMRDAGSIDGDGEAFPEDDDAATSRGVLEEFAGFLGGVVRAVSTLGRAYRTSITTTARGDGGGAGGTTLDCIWTLYCRNLDKTAKLNGLYGFLAKINSLGLRLVMGEFPLESALESLVKEFVTGSSRIDCENLFPKCSTQNAAEVVMRSVLGES